MKPLKTNFTRSSFLIFMIVALTPQIIMSQSKELSLSVYPGFTLVNFEEALGYSDEYMEDWDEFHISVSARGFLGISGKINYGAEISWQKLYYAYYIVPYGPSPVYREFNVTTFGAMILARYSVSNLFFVGGAGLHIFNDGIAPALCIESGYVFRAGDNLKFPISVRVNPVFGDGLPIPISAGAGAAFTF